MIKLRTNVDKLVKVSVIGEVASPVFRTPPYRISAFGQLIVCPGTGGIRYNVRVGSSAIDWMADHVEPGVSIKNLSSYPGTPEGPNTALNVLSCIGNEAKVVSGEAKGAIGYIIGKHGGIEHVMVDFPQDVLEKLVIGDKIQVKAFGQGLRLLDYPDITAMNIDPSLLMKMDISEENGYLVVGVTHIIPAGVMGSGLGSDHTYSGDYDITLFDEETAAKYNLKTLRLGDIVAIMDADSSYGRIYRQGAVTIGVIVHTNSYIAGHGPGVTTILTSSKGKIKPVINSRANIAYYLNLRPDISW
ncbi:MAG: DUF4438 domain-containing protein [Candidatus Methanomethylicia archaeon]|nr:DUF4438 domain-containing protein [Candidatus Methanomethylicia archaeon]